MRLLTHDPDTAGRIQRAPEQSDASRTGSGDGPIHRRSRAGTRRDFSLGMPEIHQIQVHELQFRLRLAGEAKR